MMGTVITAAVCGAIVGGLLAIAGVLAGMSIERRLQWRGKVECVVSNWDLNFQRAGALNQAMCSFDVDLFNEQPFATGIRDVRVVFVREDGEEVTGTLRDVLLREGVVLNLPPRQWFHASLHGRFDDQDARKLREFRRVEFLGYFPDGREFRQRVIDRKDFTVRRKKLFSRRKDYQPGTMWRGAPGDED